MALGVFYRRHPGEIDDISIPIKMNYSAIGVSIAPGVRLRIDEPGIGRKDRSGDRYE
jgi:hypothetical protein